MEELNKILNTKSIGTEEEYGKLYILWKRIRTTEKHLNILLKNYVFKTDMDFINENLVFIDDNFINKYDQIFVNRNDMFNFNDSEWKNNEYVIKYKIESDNTYRKPKITDLSEFVNADLYPKKKKEKIYDELRNLSSNLKYENTNNTYQFELVFMTAYIDSTVDNIGEDLYIPFSPLIFTLYTQDDVHVHFYKGVSNFCGYSYYIGEKQDIFTNYTSVKYDLDNKFTINQLTSLINNNIKTIPKHSLMKRKYDMGDDNLTTSFDGELFIVSASIDKDKLII